MIWFYLPSWLFFLFYACGGVLEEVDGNIRTLLREEYLSTSFIMNRMIAIVFGVSLLTHTLPELNRSFDHASYFKLSLFSFITKKLVIH